MIDTHCHLNDLEAFPDPLQAIREAAEAGVERIIVVGIDEEWSQIAVQLADEHEEVFAVVGHHPTSVGSFKPTSLELYRSLWQHPKVVALGEMGLDFHWKTTSPEEQLAALNAQLDLAIELSAPVVLHCRSAYPELLDLLESRPCPPLLFHCFSGDREDARRALALGSYFGVDGPVTYKSANELRAILAELPLDALVLETDAPWLAPAPYRGQRNKPAWLPWIAEGLALATGVSPEEISRRTTANAERFFRKLEG